ncbi:MAG TPA: dienelactone hydrolase family protein [Noviherbaspirillum sp.]|uniref:dienelactone hydrolase family protein n=1 Tax=Noviherbaspirillum sp. TaxID=1926288 RepID=UPI002D221730|nr:dienelactone hydrolase family protein [Noviherbaspirillum sp.]HYD95017.1 dienelactone hydrolase family protein [Noviherbaspirillum sp.]
MHPNGTMIAMKMSDGATIGAYHVEAAGQRRGGLVLVQEIFGVTGHIRDQCERFAAEGYEVLAPALFDREAPGLQASYEPEDVQAALKIAREAHPFEQSVADVQTCIDALKDKGPVFITGYCYGGSVTWAAACRCSGLAAASGYYGSLIPKLAGESPRCPTILHFGRHDQGIPLDGVEAVRAQHPQVEVYLYDAGHGFNSDRRKDFHDESATLARQRTLALFATNGG